MSSYPHDQGNYSMPQNQTAQTFTGANPGPVGVYHGDQQKDEGSLAFTLAIIGGVLFLCGFVPGLWFLSPVGFIINVVNACMHFGSSGKAKTCATVSLVLAILEVFIVGLGLLAGIIAVVIYVVVFVIILGAIASQVGQRTVHN